MGKKTDLMENVASPVVVERIKKGLNPATMDVDEEIAKIGNGPGKVWDPSTYMAKAARMAKELGINKWSNGNMSIMSAPDLNIWPFGDVFRRANMDPGVFESRATWMKHMNSANRTGKIADAIISQKPEKVFLGGSYGANILRSYIKKLKEKGVEFETTGKVVNWVSNAGMPKTSNFVIVTTPYTRMVFGPHFTAQVPKVVTDMRTALLKGTENGDPVKPVVDKVKVAKVAKKKEAAPIKMTQPKTDTGAARQKLNGYVQTLKNQGQKDAQIRAGLQKMGIPAELISELV
jgi:hypothetical protein